MRKGYKILNFLKIFFVLEVVFFLILVSDGVYKSKILQDIRAQKDFKFLIVSTDGHNFLGGYVLDYSIKKQAVLVFPINAKTRFIQNNAEKPVYLQDIYQKIYYKNKRNLDGSVKDLLVTINKIYDLDVDYFVHFSSADIVNINKLFDSNLNLNFSNITNSDSEDKAILQKYIITREFLSIFNFFEFFKVFGIVDLTKFHGYNFAEKTLQKWDTNIENTNINLTEIFCLIMTFYKIEKLNLVFVGFNNVLYDNDNFYIRDAMKKIDDKSDEIVIEVLNGSGKKGKALDITRFLRDHNFDVQEWGNYGAINDTTMIIDRKGNWQNAATVASFLKKGIVFSKKDENSLSDVSIILGKDFI